MMPRPQIVPAFCLLVLTALAGCAPRPFDATAPWVPQQPARGTSFAGGVLGSPPDLGFQLFERDRPPAAEVSVPSAVGENPWATPTRNVVVAICYSSWLNSAEAVRQTALSLCPEGARLRFLGQDGIWNACPLAQPTRAVYRCLPPEGTDTGSGAAG